MEESATIKMSQDARDLAAQGHEVISLSLGEPDFDTPEHIKEAAKQALDNGYTKYTPVPGLPMLREAISEKLERDNDLHYKPSQIVVSNGAKQTIANLSLSLLGEGDECIVFAPYWVSYYEIIRLSEATPVPIYAGIEQDFKVTPEQLREAITPRTRMILFSSPCNPTGSVYTRQELEALSEVVLAHDDIVVVSDEIYEYINFMDRHVSIGAIDGMQDRTVTVNGFSKGFAMTGWRLGYMGAPQYIADACSKMQGQFTSGANAFGQVAAAHALRADMQPTLDMKAAFAKRRALVLTLLREIPDLIVNEPQGAFYVFFNVSAYFGRTLRGYDIADGDAFCTYLLHEAHVAIVPGSAFGADAYARLSYASSEAALREAIGRMKAALTV